MSGDEDDLDLFCGAGGVALGLSRVGVDALGIDYWERACQTHEKNGFRTLRADLATIDWSPWAGRVRLMWASPPCQPWSAAGDQEGEFDDRDGIPWWLRAVEQVRPRVIVMENVKGLTFEKHRPYLSGVIAAIRALGYRIDYRVLDAADYGVPQNRERFILIGRNDDGPLRWPEVTHTEDGGLFTAPWATMADALGWGCDGPYAAITAGHDRSFSGDGLGVRQRQVIPDAVRLEVWEAAVLQGFPADYEFLGNRTEQATQVGNAVPPPLAAAIVVALLSD